METQYRASDIEELINMSAQQLNAMQVEFEKLTEAGDIAGAWIVLMAMSK